MHTQFYDQVLTEIQSGNVKDGVTLLVGMLDTVSHDECQFTAASTSLKAHDLWALLLEDPMCGLANAVPRQPDLLIDLICDHPLDVATSSTGQRLFEVTTSLTFARAIRERAKIAEEKLVRAWQAGAQICILGIDNLRALRSLENQYLSNIIFVDPDPRSLQRSMDAFGPSLHCVNATPEAFLKSSAEATAPFDLICATALADHLQPAALEALLSLGRDCLAAQGALQIASFVPQHLGTGWRRACLGWDINCHNEPQIAASAARAGLCARTYRDTSDSVIWSEFRRANKELNEGGLRNGY